MTLPAFSRENSSAPGDPVHRRDLGAAALEEAVAAFAFRAGQVRRVRGPALGELGVAELAGAVGLAGPVVVPQAEGVARLVAGCLGDGLGPVPQRLGEDPGGLGGGADPVEHPGDQTVLAVSHGGFLRAVLPALLLVRQYNCLPLRGGVHSHDCLPPSRHPLHDDSAIGERAQ